MPWPGSKLKPKIVFDRWRAPIWIEIPLWEKWNLFQVDACDRCHLCGPCHSAPCCPWPPRARGEGGAQLWVESLLSQHPGRLGELQTDVSKTKFANQTSIVSFRLFISLSHCIIFVRKCTFNLAWLVLVRILLVLCCIYNICIGISAWHSWNRSSVAHLGVHPLASQAVRRKPKSTLRRQQMLC